MIDPAFQSATVRSNFGSFIAIPAALAVVIATAWSFVAWRVDGFATTLLLYGGVVAAGLAAIHVTARRTTDPAVERVAYVFLIKLAVLLLMLCIFWEGSLESTGPVRDGDQQRFYYQAAHLANHGFRLESLPSLNYTGVLFIYGAVFALFGHNAFAPALVNSLATLVTVLLLIRVAFRINPEHGRHGWMLGLAMLIPEVAMHDTMTSRDALVLSLLSIPVLATANFLLGEATRKRTLTMTAIGVPALILLSVVRMPALFPAVASIFALSLLFRTRLKPIALVAIVIAGLILLAAAPWLSESAGGYRIDYGQMAGTSAVGSDAEFLALFNWHPRSIGKLLIPETMVQAIALTPLRVIGYLIAPLPTLGMSRDGLARGEWFHWVLLLIVFSSVLYVIIFPLALASLVDALRTRHAALALQVPFWITIVALVSGTALIHERYRLMALPLLAGCVWLGASRPRHLVIRSYIVWGVILLVGGGSAMAYKALPCDLPRIASQTKTATIAVGAAAKLSVVAAGDDVEFQWFRGSSGYVFSAVRGARGPALVVSPSVESVYWVRVSNPCGFVDSASIVVDVRPAGTGRQ